MLDASANDNAQTAWEAARRSASSQDPNPQDVTSSTQWSVVFSNTGLTAGIALRRHWSDVTHFQL